MKKIYVFIITALIAVSAVSAVCIFGNQTDPRTLMDANIEALAQNENIYPDGYVECWNVHNDSYDPTLYLEVRECVNCTMKKISSASKADLPCML